MIELHGHKVRKRGDNNRLSGNISNVRGINMSINSMLILQQWSNNRMIIDRYIINQGSTAGTSA